MFGHKFTKCRLAFVNLIYLDHHWLYYRTYIMFSYFFLFAFIIIVTWHTNFIIW